MFDLAALEAAGFEKTLSDEEWVDAQAAFNSLYGREGVTVNYVLLRGEIRLVTEQNTQEQEQFGVQTTVQYPEVAVLEHVNIPTRRVAVDASNTALILAVADDLARPADEGSSNVRGGR